MKHEKHMVSIADMENYSVGIELYSQVGRSANKRLVCRVTPKIKTMIFVVINQMDNYEKEHDTLESAIDDYNMQ